MSLLENIHQEKVAELPLREALLARADLPVTEAIALMKSKRLGCVIVVDDNQKPLGTFTERSLVELLATSPQGLESAVVADHLDSKWACVSSNEPILSVVKGMQVEGVRFAVVLDSDGRATALTGQRGLMEYVADHYPQQVLVQRAGSKPPAEREGA